MHIFKFPEMSSSGLIQRAACLLAAVHKPALISKNRP